MTSLSDSQPCSFPVLEEGKKERKGGKTVSRDRNR